MSDAEQRPDPRKSLRLFRTIPHPCSYLDNEEASTVFVDPEVIPSIDLLSELSEIGFQTQRPTRLQTRLRELQCLRVSKDTH